MRFKLVTFQCDHAPLYTPAEIKGELTGLLSDMYLFVPIDLRAVDLGWYCHSSGRFLVLFLKA